jgi:AcrR family transcriptional regulator
MPRKTERRVRRTPEEARALILDAAARVFATSLPDVVGLKDVAAEAGVSHALVTHYFGTYAALVEATLEERFRRLRAELLPTLTALVASDADALALLAAYRAAIDRAASDPATLRLFVWALLGGRVAAEDFFTHRLQGLKLIADTLASRSRAPREDLEFLLVTTFASATVWSLGKHAFAGALGRRLDADYASGFERRSAALVEGYLRRAEDVDREGSTTP